MISDGDYSLHLQFTTGSHSLKFQLVKIVNKIGAEVNRYHQSFDVAVLLVSKNNSSIAYNGLTIFRIFVDKMENQRISIFF